MNTEIRGYVTALASQIPQRGADGCWDVDGARETFERLVADGWHLVGLPEILGGSGGTIEDALDVAAAMAFAGATSPVGDLAVVTNHVLTILGAELPPGARTVCVPGAAQIDAEGGVAVPIQRVPWAAWATHLLVPCMLPDGSAHYTLVAREHVELSSRSDLAGAPLDVLADVDADALELVPSSLDVADLVAAIRTAGALVRSVQMAAAMSRMSDLTVDYSEQRHQFGRSIGRFQVVQQKLAAMAAEVISAGASVDRAIARCLPGDGQLDVEAVAVAKVRTGLAVDQVSALCHQVHGAIGITQEYELARHSLHVWSWRDDFGSTDEWAQALARHATSAGIDLWEWVTNDG